MTDFGPLGPPAGCPGVPSECRHASLRLLQAGEGIPDPARIAALRRELQNCGPCTAAFDLQMNVQQIVALHCREQAPESLRIRISETLQRIDLSGLDVTDL